MLIKFDDLCLKYQDYADIKGKVRREVARGNLIEVSKGIYESDMNVDGKYLAGIIYGPSYLSFDYALYTHSLIPEVVYKMYTSATYKKNKSKMYRNSFGLFSYRDVPSYVYSLGVEIKEENGYSYQIATAEKAICDKLYTLSPIGSIKGLKGLLFEDLRIDENSFYNLNLKNMIEIAKMYRSTNLRLLARLLEETR